MVGLDSMVVAPLVVMGVASFAICHWIAALHGGNGVFWGVMRFCFGPLAIPFAFLARPGTAPGPGE
jgi:hypothetical protein